MGDDCPTLLISYHEVKFLEAEALCRLGGRNDEAKAALKDAVVAAFANLENSVANAADYWLGGDADFLGSHDRGTGPSSQKSSSSVKNVPLATSTGLRR